MTHKQALKFLTENKTIPFEVKTLCVDALNRQIPTKPIKFIGQINGDIITVRYTCANCGNRVDKYQYFCDECGQQLDRSEEDEEI